MRDRQSSRCETVDHGVGPFSQVVYHYCRESGKRLDRCPVRRAGENSREGDSQSKNFVCWLGVEPSLRLEAERQKLGALLERGPGKEDGEILLSSTEVTKA
jgi:hypothetical protein